MTKNDCLFKKEELQAANERKYIGTPQFCRLHGDYMQDVILFCHRDNTNRLHFGASCLKRCGLIENVCGKTILHGNSSLLPPRAMRLNGYCDGCGEKSICDITADERTIRHQCYQTKPWSTDLAFGCDHDSILIMQSVAGSSSEKMATNSYYIFDDEMAWETVQLLLLFLCELG